MGSFCPKSESFFLKKCCHLSFESKVKIYDYFVAWFSEPAYFLLQQGLCQSDNLKQQFDLFRQLLEGCFRG
jgi:hypothetical protein